MEHGAQVMSTRTFEIPVGHVDDPDSIARISKAYIDLHEGRVEVAVRRWSGPTRLNPIGHRTTYRFVVSSEGATVSLQSGDQVRGGQSKDRYDFTDDGHPRAKSNFKEMVWPGVALMSSEELGPLLLDGTGVYFEIVTETTSYPAPKVSLLRNLSDHPGGCAPYDDAFRRETVPPAHLEPGSSDKVGANRVNEHTLDMRIDRHPPPTQHHHGSVVGADGCVWNHTETAVVLPRSVYGRPPLNDSEEGHAVIFRDPLEKGTEDAFRVPLRPGSIVVTPSTTQRLYGHCFENAFAMLIAVPGFVAPYEMIQQAS